MRYLAALLALVMAVASAAPRPYVAPVCPPAPAGTYVAGSQLYNADGTELHVHGVNNNHWDMTDSYRSIALTGANAVRVVMPLLPTGTPAYLQSMLDRFVAQGLVVVPSYWDGTCKTDVASFRGIVDRWVQQRAVYAKYDSVMLLNVANEWGPTAGGWTYDAVLRKNVYTPNYVWRDEYIRAVQMLRAVGYTNTIVVDAGNCGQDATLVVRDGPAILASDPQSNVLFDVHVYGGFHKPATASWMQDYDTAMASLKASGLPILVGEFGPGRNVGPSPTMVKPEDVIALAEQNGWGWMAWAYGDNNLPKCQADDYWFSMTRNCGLYTGTNDDAELTTFGKTVVPILRSHLSH